jgi:prephenate dehydrogenase
MKLGIIGYGRMGRLLTRYLAQDFHVSVYDPHVDTEPARSHGANPVDFAEICRQPAILPLVPISAFEGVIQSIAPHLQPGTLLIDACSVKMKPVAAMQQYLPPEVHILGTHPMFGPDSAADTLFGGKIVLCPVRIPDQRYREIFTYLEKHGLKVIEATPEEHDEQISASLFLAHFVGRTLIEAEAGPVEIDTKGYRRLMKILLTVENDSWQLFEDMYHYNPFAPQMRARWEAAMAAVGAKLNL